MTKTVWAIQHIGYEDLGSFEPVLKKRGFEISYLRSRTVDYKGLFAYDPDLVIDLGGPMGVYEDDKHPWINDELAFICDRVECEKPLMGICFGAQLIARALGAKVYKGEQGKEIGWSKISVNDEGMKTPFRHFDGSKTMMMHWHGDTFDLPDGAVLLASSDKYHKQAYIYGDHIFAMQCHPEITENKLRLWYAADKGELAEVGTTVEEMKSDAHRYAETLTCQTEKFLNEWLDEQGF
jgi:GMP synthase (glutamine-hydrolysing)